MTSQQNIGSIATSHKAGHSTRRSVPEDRIETHPAFNSGLPEERRPGSRQKRNHEFRGYTLEELRYRRLVNSLKIDIAQERLRMTISPQAKQEAEAVSGAVNGFQSIMRIVDIAMVAFGVARRVGTFFRKFSRRN